jgi:starvation-inducible DNA-binding protein
MNSHVIEELGKLLASNYTLYLKTQNFHWNVTGPFFQTLHLMFEDQYTALALSNDVIAERIRSLGAPAPATYREYASLSFIEEPNTKLNAQDMVQSLVEDNQKIVDFSKALIAKAAEVKDEGTIDLLTTRVSDLEKTIWMLKSFLEV